MTTFVDQTTTITAAFMNAVAAVIESTAVAAIANGVTPAADTIPYFTGASAASQTTLSAFARTLLDDPDAATMRTTLGVSSNSLDAELAAIAGLNSANNTIPYFTGVGSAALADFTATGRTIVACASAAAVLAAIGAAGTASPTFTGTVTLPTTVLGNSAITGIKTISFNSVINEGNVTSAATIDFGTSQFKKCTMTGDTTFTFTAPPGPCILHLEIYQDGTGSRVATFPASVKWDTSYAAGDKLLSTTASARDLLVLKYNGTDYVANLLKAIA